ncbi:hypothetical protein DM794_03910 [Paenarthrobacter ureafaciens]|uniref:Uncharacterized protein n=1 Tax=Paenarthrobacter nitroguajacolicus TaxID=211146 RepID=A0A558H6G8_PAENT|nr:MULTISPECIES: hypothetical protein [Paenarthrobacter]NWL26210.1 hypothetical protein [Paenarthrobacter ureafaciens]QSZ52020.1 hypothetical protein AYX19_02680 [Paenarthrobacter ureafaciens]TVU64724.1 hypothetical protein FQP90_06570 [Paenarthrobacter nitroguajacolicus]WOC61252.1 hypothetical protein RI444_00890 [Paenarthrobacter sp. AT5]
MQAGISSCAERITGWITSVVASNTKRIELLIINEVVRLTSTILSELRGHTTAAASGEIAARFAEVIRRSGFQSAISPITEKVIGDMNEWWNRPQPGPPDVC